MKQIHKNKKGFSAVEALLILVILGLVAGAGWYVYGRTQVAKDEMGSNEVAKTQDTKETLEFEDGLRLEPDTFGVAKGKPVADVSAVKLEDGNWRIYAFAQDKGIVSATSKDGLTFKAESGVRMGEGAGMPRVIKLSNGKYRMYFIDQGGVGSSISSDGLNFTKEDGLRIESPSGVDAITGISTPVKLSDGKYHTYFSDLPRPGEGVKTHKIYSATSTNLVDWKLDSGYRIGGSKVSSTAEHPDAVLNENGEVVLYYFVNQPQKLVTSNSKDGLEFGEETDTGLNCNDPNIVNVSGDQYRVYCGDFQENIGGIVKSFLTDVK